MTRRWVLRILVTALALPATMVLMAFAGMGPRPLLIAGLTIAGVIVYWTAADVASMVEPARWTVHPGEASVRGGDTRVDHLRWRLSARPDSEVEVDNVAPLLVQLIDDRVAENYGVDRTSDPDAFDRIVGPELARFIASPPTAARTRNPAFLAGMLTRIESL